MKEWLSWELIGNKLIALAFVVIMNISLKSEIAPLVWILCLPTAVILTFAKRNYCD